MRIRLPNKWSPRPYQLKGWSALESGIKRAVFANHRRSGKDDIGLHWTATQAMQKKANYWYLLPQANQARKAIWTAVDSHVGMKRIDWAFPLEIRESTNDQEMLIRFKNGSTWQVVGSDNYQGVIGSGAYGIVFSEYMLSDPNAYLYIDPILRENGGWAIFNGTPRGRNHFYGLYQLSQTEPGWYGERLTVADTGIFTRDQLETIRRQIAAERGDDDADNIIAQEYYCSWDAAIPGSYYGKLIAALEQEDCIGSVSYDPRYPVITAWDIGVGDSTAIWFVQQTRTSLNIIDYYETSGVGADHYAKVIKEKPYMYDYHILPHDADDREWGNNASSRVDSLKSLGVRPLRIMPRASVEDGINAVRIILHGARFDRKRCQRGIDALRQYQRTWDDKLKVFSQKPLHDWTSHACFEGSTHVWTRYGIHRIMDLPESGEVLTTCGWKAYVNPRITERNAPLVEVTFESGYSVRCTPDHLFKTVSGWKCAAHLTKGTETRTTAKPLTIASVKPLDYRTDVWDLTVPDGHEFALGNGAIVHNSDAFRYLAQGLKDVPRTAAHRPAYSVT